MPEPPRQPGIGAFAAATRAAHLTLSNGRTRMSGDVAGERSAVTLDADRKQHVHVIRYRRIVGWAQIRQGTWKEALHE